MRTAIRLASFVAICLAAASAAAQPAINILSGRGNSAYYALGVALASDIETAAPSLKVSVIGTKGSLENLDRLESGTGDIAFASGDTLSDAVKGSQEADSKSPLTKLRGIAALYSDYIQIFARADSGVRTLGDLAGKRVSVGAQKSPIELDARRIFAAAGLPYSRFGSVEYFPFGESVELMKDRQLDATLQSAAAGALPLRDLANAVDIVIVPVPRDVVDRIDNRAYIPAMIQANTYRGQLADVPVVAVRNYLIAREDLSADMVYAVTKALWTGFDRLAAIHPPVKTTDRTHALDGMPVPLHPGAERYYREIKLIRSPPQRRAPARPHE